MTYLKYLKNRRKFNNYRIKLAIPLFFAEFRDLQGKSNYQFASLTLHSKKIMEKLPKKYYFGKKFIKIHFSAISSEISKKFYECKIVDHKFMITKVLSDF